MRNVRSTIALALIIFFSCPLYGALDREHIVVLLSEEGGAYREFADGFVSRLNADLADPPSVDVVPLKDARFDKWRGSAAPRAIVTVGTRAAQETYIANVAVPTLRVLVARAAHESWNRPGNNNASAIFLEQPWDRQFDLIKRILPAAHHVGVILGPASRQDAHEIKRAAAQRELTLHVREISRADDAGSAFTDVVADSEAVLAIPDPVVLSPNSAKWLLYTAYQRGIPVIGFSRAYVNAGALGSVYTTPEQIGFQAARLVANAMHDTGWTFGPAVYPEYFSVAINRSVARSLRLEVPADEDVLRKLNAPEVSP